MRGVGGSRSHWLATVSALALLLGRAPAQAETAPATPSGLTASVASPSQVNLTWTDNSDNEFAFAVWRQSGSDAFARVAVLVPNTISFTDTGLTPGTTYTYEVRATNNVGASPWSNQATVALVPPAAPSNLAVSSFSAAAVALTWMDNSNYETAFAVWRSAGGGAFARAAVLPPNSTSYTDTAVTAETTYTYEVRATNNVGASPWSNQTTVTPTNLPPAVPTGLVTTAVSGSQVTLAWSDNSNNETAFAIWRQGGGAGWARVGVVAPNTTSFTDTNISPNTTYTYQVRAIDNVGASDWSNQVTAATSEWAAALAAAEGGLNWEIGRINNRLWGKDDSGNTVTTLDLWPTSTGPPPATASSVVLMTDASGNWTQRFLAGTSVSPYDVSAGGTFTITAEGQVRTPDGNIVKVQVACSGAGLISLFDTQAVFAFSDSTSTAAPAWYFSGSCTVVGGCGSNGLIYGNGGPTITVGPLGLWGSSASITGVTTAGITTLSRRAVYTTDTADAVASLLYSGGASTTAYTVGSWRPTGYSATTGQTLSPADSYGRGVNTQAEIVVNAPGTPTDGVFVRSVLATEFLDSNRQPVLQSSLIPNWSGSGYRLRLLPGVYYFAKIALQNNNVVEIANDWYKADGVTPLWDANHNAINGPATVDDYNSFGNRITLFVDAITNYQDSTFGSGLFTALLGDQSANNPLRHRRPGNFRIYAKNTGNFNISGSSSAPVEFNADVLHYNEDSSGNYYGSVTLSSGCHLYGGVFAWTVSMSGGALVQQYGTDVFSPSDPAVVVPTIAGAGIGGGISGSSDILAQEMERVRQLNWTGLAEQTSWATCYYYDAGGNPVGAPGAASPVMGGFVSYIKVETLNNNALSLAQTPTVDTTGGTSRSLRRVTIVVQPAGVSLTATPPTAQGITYLTLGGP